MNYAPSGKGLRFVIAEAPKLCAGCEGPIALTEGFYVQDEPCANYCVECVAYRLMGTGMITGGPFGT